MRTKGRGERIELVNHCPILISLYSLEEGGEEERSLDGGERIGEEREGRRDEKRSVRRRELRGSLSALIHLLSPLKGPTCRLCGA